MTDFSNMRCTINRSIFQPFSRLYLVSDIRKDGKRLSHVHQFGTPHVHEEGFVFVDVPATIALPDNEFDRFLQQMVDAAWGEGIKPTALAATTIEYEAQNKHLQDMRRLVFKDKF